MSLGTAAALSMSTGSQTNVQIEALYAKARVFQQFNQFSEACSWYEKVIEKDPDHFDALLRLGLLEHQRGNDAAAVKSFRRAVTVNPNSSVAYTELAAVLQKLHQHEEALACYGKIVTIDANSTDDHYRRGHAFIAMGRLTEAVSSFDEVNIGDPKHAAALIHRGNALHALRRFGDALASYHGALALEPAHVEALINRGVTYEELGQQNNAIADFDRALELAPDHAVAWHNRGDALFYRLRYDEAMTCYDRALQSDPKLSQAWIGRANIFMRTGRVAQALNACERALELTPDGPKALLMMGQCLALKGDAETAVQFFDRSLAVRSDDEVALVNRIFSLDFCQNADFAVHQEARAEWWRRIGTRIAAQHPPHHQNDRDPTRRIILGYVSADFRLHSAASNFLPVLENHDKTRFEVICYSATLQEDDVTKFFRNMADRWRNITQWSDDRLAKCIKDDQVDILIDLSGPSEGNRLRAFARKPAPIQVTAWGHATGTGQPTIDYLFSDPVLVPSEARHLFAEQICDLPCVIIIQPPPDELRSDEPPVTSNGYLTYGVFNRVRKISSAAISVWARILRSDTTARLVVKDHALSDSFFQNTLSDHFARLGIDLDRIELIGRTSRADHMKAYGRVDICLDPFPHGGGVSTWEALYMGVPVVTKLGNSITQRLGGAILSAIGMNEWIATDDDQYVDIALKPTTDRLRTLRRTLPDMIHARCSPVAYTKAVEHAYQVMWKKYCAN